MPTDKRVRLRPLVGEETDHGLQQRGRHLEREGQEADLAESEPVVGFQDRINRRQQRLHHVVQQMAEADRGEDGERRRGGVLRRAAADDVLTGDDSMRMSAQPSRAAVRAEDSRAAGHAL